MLVKFIKMFVPSYKKHAVYNPLIPTVTNRGTKRNKSKYVQKSPIIFWDIRSKIKSKSNLHNLFSICCTHPSSLRNRQENSFPFFLTFVHQLYYYGPFCRYTNVLLDPFVSLANSGYTNWCFLWYCITPFQVRKFSTDFNIS